MAISRSFGGQTLLKPGAYSVSRVDNAQGIAVGENNTLMLIGEASDGVPGGIENSRVFTNIQGLVDYYVSGDIVDAALAAGRPSITPGISAPTNFIIYKTNASLAAAYSFEITVATAGSTEITFSVTFPINASGETFTENVAVTVDSTGTDLTTAAMEVVEALIAGSPNLVSVFDITSAGAIVTFTAKKNGPQFGVFSAGARNVANPEGKVVFGVPVPADPVVITIANFSAESRTQAVLDALGATTAGELGAGFYRCF